MVHQKVFNQYDERASVGNVGRYSYSRSVSPVVSHQTILITNCNQKDKMMKIAGTAKKLIKSGQPRFDPRMIVSGVLLFALLMPITTPLPVFGYKEKAPNGLTLTGDDASFAASLENIKDKLFSGFATSLPSFSTNR